MASSAAAKGVKPRAPIAPSGVRVHAVPTPASIPPAASSAPAAAAPVPIPRASGVDCKTVREILPPWEVLQDKLNKKAPSAPVRNEVLNQDAQQALAAQEAANALWSPPAAKSSPYASHASGPYEAIESDPPSGVRVSEAGLAAGPAIGEPVSSVRSSLSFKVYTASDSPISMRSSRVNFDMTASRSSLHWQRALVALKAFAKAAVEWAKIKGERPSYKVALRKPFDELGDELQVAVESVDWKSLGVKTGIIVGATLTLLFAVLTAAELTDDLKPPGSAAHLASAETTGIPAKTVADPRVAPATNMAAMGIQPVAAPVAEAAPPPAPEASSPVSVIGDIDTPDAPAATPAKKAAVKKPKPKNTKLALRSSPF